MVNQRYKGKKILVTGGTGFIGARIAERLRLEEGADVAVLVNKWYNAAWVSRSDLQFVQADIKEPAAVEDVVNGADIVFHCVGVGGDRKTCMEVNVGGTRNVLEAAVKYDVKRVVYLSTIGVHGPFIQDGLSEESQFVSVGNPYGDSKIKAEEVFWEYIKKGSIKGTVLRPSYVWGPRSAWFTVQPVLDMARGKFFLVNGGSGACNAVHVDNVVDLALIAGENDAALGEAFLVTDGARHSWGEFFSHYAAMVGKKIEDFPSVDSNPAKSLKHVALKNVKKVIGVSQLGAESLYSGMVMRFKGEKYKWFRAPFWLARVSLASSVEMLERFSPAPFLDWDLKKFSSPGFVDISKADRLLGFKPEVSIENGMKECEFWLRDQKLIN